MTHVPGCTGKKKYGDRAIADSLVENSRHRTGKRLYVYQCVTCHCWHLSGMSLEQHELGMRRHLAGGVHIPERRR